MTPERAELIRETWRRVSHRALQHFALCEGIAWEAEMFEPVHYIPGETSAPVVRHRLIFIHEVRRRERPTDTQAFRVVCEGVVVATGEYDW